MEQGRPIRNVSPRRPRSRPVPQRRQDEANQDDDNEGQGKGLGLLPDIGGFFKGKGKNTQTRPPFFTITFGTPTTETITAISTVTLEPSSTSATTTTLVTVSTPKSTLIQVPPLPTPITTLVPGTTLPPTTSSSVETPSSSSLSTSLPADTTPVGETTPPIDTPVDIPSPTEVSLPPPTTLSTIRAAEPSGSAFYGGVNPEPTGQPPVASAQTAGLTSTQTAGIAVGSVFGLILLLALLIFGFRKWRQSRLPGFVMMPGSRTQDPFFDAGVGQSDLTFRDFPPPPPPQEVTKPKPSVSKWVNQMRQLIPVRSPEPFSVSPGDNEKEPPVLTANERKKPTRSIMSTIFRPHHTPSPPPGSRGSQSTPSTGGGRSRVHRQSGVSDTSFWTTAPTQRDSSIFVPPTALSYPRVVISSPLTEAPEREFDRPPPLPVEDIRRTVRFSAPDVASSAPSIRASVISSESRHAY
ncbi:hypothetical protein OQA88_2245 [Cercophora sp. LCS_1]